MTRARISIFELPAVLLPVVAAFAVTGMTGWHLGRLYIKPSDVALLTALPVTLALFLRKDSVRTRSPLWPIEKRIWILFLAWLTLCLVLKGLPISDLKQVRLVILRAVLTFFIGVSFGSSLSRYRAILLAIGFGCLLSYLRYFFFVGWPDYLAVRPLPNRYIAMSLGYRYIWVAVSGASIWVLALLLRGTSRFLTLARVAVSLVRMIAILSSGTRAIIYSLPILLLVRLSAKMRQSLYIVRGAAYVSITLGLLFALVPMISTDLVPYYTRMRMSATDDGGRRLVDADTVESGIVVRLTDWIALSKQDLGAKFLGEPYDRAMSRVFALGHPHNLFLLLEILAGWPAAILGALGLATAISRVATAVQRAKESSPRTLMVAVLFLLVCLTFILPTNSAVMNIPLLLGFLVSCPTHIAIESSERKQSGVAEG